MMRSCACPTAGMLVAVLALAGCGDPAPTTSLLLSSVTQANGRYVAVGARRDERVLYTPSRSVVLTSTDGATWSQASLTAKGQLNQVAYGNGRFLAVGGELVSRAQESGFDTVSVVLTSTDGVAWSEAPSPTTATLESVAFGDGLFVVIAADGKAFSSSDGAQWESAATGLTGINTHDVAFGGGRFVVAEADSTIATSTDALTWSTSAGSTRAPTKYISFAAGAFFASIVEECADEGCTPSHGLIRSEDGTSWGSSYLPTEDEVLRIANDHGVYVAGAAGGILRSTDGMTWSATSVPVEGVWSSVTAGPAGFVAVGRDAILTSADGATWSQSYSFSP